MRYNWLAFVLISIGVVSTAYGSMRESGYDSLREPHRYSKKECRMCHVDADKVPGILKPMESSICEGCHSDIGGTQSHPVDISPATSTPPDMPLVDGKLTCITCHFVHPFSTKYKKFSYFLLRRPGKGLSFCTACHGIDEKGHTIFENVHPDSYRVTDRNGSLDTYTLQCVECHDKHLDNAFGPDSTGREGRFRSRANHPVGVSHESIASRYPRKYNPAGVLPKEIRLFDGKIGCGTCHTVYSKEKFMLVSSNLGSKLCLECHIL